MMKCLLICTIATKENWDHDSCPCLCHKRESQNMVKLRHVNKDSHDAYDRPDLNALLSFEDKHFGELKI